MRCVSMTPLEIPVVPDVYSMLAVSSIWKFCCRCAISLGVSLFVFC